MEYQLPKKIENIVKSNRKSDTKVRLIAKEITKNDRSSHEYAHHQRVYSIAKKIVNDSKTKIDYKSLLAVCYFHDLGYCIDVKDKRMILRSGNSKNHEYRGVILSEAILPSLGYSNKQIREINKAIKSHRRKERKEKHKLTAIIQDADIIEVIGAIGLTRWFRYAEANKIPTYNPKIPFSKLKYGKKENYSVIHNLESCASNIHKDLNLQSSKKISKGRERIVKAFIREYLREFKSQEKLPSGYFGIMKLAELFRKKSERELVNSIKKTIRKAQVTNKLVKDCLHLLEKDIKISKKSLNRLMTQQSGKDLYFVAVKLFLEDKAGRLFISKDKFGVWDLPGGRLRTNDFNTSLEKIVARKVKEELGSAMRYRLGKPVVFMRHERMELLSSGEKEKRRIFAIGYRTKYLGGEIKLSLRHLEYKWVELKSFRPEKYFKGGWLKGVKNYIKIIKQSII